MASSIDWHRQGAEPLMLGDSVVAFLAAEHSLLLPTAPYHEIGPFFCKIFPFFVRKASSLSLLCLSYLIFHFQDYGTQFAAVA